MLRCDPTEPPQTAVNYKYQGPACGSVPKGLANRSIPFDGRCLAGNVLEHPNHVFQRIVELTSFSGVAILQPVQPFSCQIVSPRILFDFGHVYEAWHYVSQCATTRKNPGAPFVIGIVIVVSSPTATNVKLDMVIQLLVDRLVENCIILV